MGILYNRLLIILNEESADSTYYHIALVMLNYIDELESLSINELADLCSVSKSTISKFVRFIGYEDFSDFRYAVPFRDNRYDDSSYNYVVSVMEYIRKNSMEMMVRAVQEDIQDTFEKLDWKTVDRLVRDLYQYENVGMFGLMFSESAAMDFQVKLGYNKKFVVTNINDAKQAQFIQNAGEDTLIIIFSNSGEYINQYHHIEDFAHKRIFSKTRGKVVLITSNKQMADDPRISYCLFFQRGHSLCSQQAVFAVLTDILAYKYREYVKKKDKLNSQLEKY